VVNTFWVSDDLYPGAMVQHRVAPIKIPMKNQLLEGENMYMSEETELNQIILNIAAIMIDELKLEDVTPETFDPDLDLVDEVGVDSMDLATMALILRDRYSVRIDEDDYPKLVTLRLISEYIQNRISSRDEA
jgi:acyl carrier protein